MDNFWCGHSDTQLLVEPTEGVTDDVELVPELLHHAVDAGSVFEDVHALGVRVVPYREGTLDGLGKLPVDCSHSKIVEWVHKFSFSVPPCLTFV